MTHVKSASTQVGYILTFKPWTRLERLARDKPFRILRTFVNYGVKISTTLGLILQNLNATLAQQQQSTFIIIIIIITF